jgi:predicted ATPase
MGALDLYHVPNGPAADDAMARAFAKLAEAQDGDRVLRIEQRSIYARKRAGGVVWFVELKTATGRLSPLQKVFAADMARLGMQYSVIRSKEEVDKWMLNRQSILPTHPTAPKI